jgi:hypothetical protein
MEKKLVSSSSYGLWPHGSKRLCNITVMDAAAGKLLDRLLQGGCTTTTLKLNPNAQATQGPWMSKPSGEADAYPHYLKQTITLELMLIPGSGVMPQAVGGVTELSAAIYRIGVCHEPKEEPTQITCWISHLEGWEPNAR